jgi:hypothetical protein
MERFNNKCYDSLVNYATKVYQIDSECSRLTFHPSCAYEVIKGVPTQEYRILLPIRLEILQAISTNEILIAVLGTNTLVVSAIQLKSPGIELTYKRKLGVYPSGRRFLIKF